MLSRTPGESSSRGNIHRRRTKGSIEFRGQRTGEASQTELPQRLSNRELARAIYTVCRRRKIKSAYVRVCVCIYMCCISGKERNGPRHPILPRDESGADNGRARAHIEIIRRLEREPWDTSTTRSLYLHTSASGESRLEASSRSHAIRAELMSCCKMNRTDLSRGGTRGWGEGREKCIRVRCARVGGGAAREERAETHL